MFAYFRTEEVRAKIYYPFRQVVLGYIWLSSSHASPFRHFLFHIIPYCCILHINRFNVSICFRIYIYYQTVTILFNWTLEGWASNHKIKGSGLVSFTKIDIYHFCFEPFILILKFISLWYYFTYMILNTFKEERGMKEVTINSFLEI